MTTKEITSYVYLIYLKLSLFMAFVKKRIELEDTTVLPITKINIDKGNHVIARGAYLSKTRITTKGSNNSVVLDKGKLFNTDIYVKGDNNTVTIQFNAKLYNSRITIRGNGCAISIGSKTTVGNMNAICMGVNNSICIGNSCMIAEGVEIWSTDGHAITDKETREILNPSKPVVIGNHVWIGKNVSILKGSKIGNGSIIGMSSLVSGTIPEDCIAVGNPVKVKKTGVVWDDHYTKS